MILKILFFRSQTFMAELASRPSTSRLLAGDEVMNVCLPALESQYQLDQGPNV